MYTVRILGDFLSCIDMEIRMNIDIPFLCQFIGASA